MCVYVCVCVCVCAGGRVWESETATDNAKVVKEGGGSCWKRREGRGEIGEGREVSGAGREERGEEGGER